MTPVPRLAPWLQFFRERSHVLNRYPELLWQDAANQPPDSAVAHLARRAVDRGNQPWLEQLELGRRAGAELLTLRGHTDLVAAVVVSAETSRIVSSGLDRTIRIWDAEDGQETFRLSGHAGPIRALARTPDGRRVVSAGDDMMLLVWYITTGTELRMIAGNYRAVTAIAGFHQRPWVVTGTQDGTVNVFDLDQGSRLFTLAGHRATVGTLAVSGDDRLIASGSRDCTVRIWDVSARREVHLLRGHQESVAAVAFTPDGAHLLSAFREVLLWECARGRRVRRWPTAADPVRALVLMQDGKHFLSASGQGVLMIRGCFGKHPTRTLRVPGKIDRLVLDGHRVYSTAGQGHDHTVKVWDLDRLEADQPETRHSADVNAVAFTSNGHLVSGSSDESVRIWDPERGSLLHSLVGHREAVSAVATDRSAAVIVSGGGGYWSKASSIVRWNAGTGRRVGEIRIPGARVTALAVTPDGHQLVAGLDTRNSANVVQLWDARRRRLLRSLSEHRGEITGLAIAGQDVISVSRGVMVHSSHVPASTSAVCASGTWSWAASGSPFRRPTSGFTRWRWRRMPG